jgi:bacterioferritin-associated ferredoxin
MSNIKNKKDIIICRCQDITLEEVEKAIDNGITHPEQLKRFLHIGMGPCQGRTCGQLVTRILARKTGKSPATIKNTSTRPPLVSIPIKELLENKDE